MSDKIVQEMIEAAPPGQHDLDYNTREALHRLTGLLLEADDTALGEYERFLNIRQRELPLAAVTGQLRAAYQGRRILVTGGTGCIGAALIRQLELCRPGEIFAVYNDSNEFDPIPGVVYLDVDIRDAVATRSVVQAVRPDVMFHCAAQRSPMLAEREVRRTVLTNVIGTRNVLRAARAADVPRFIHASTGKAMRYYSTDIYAASKKVAEWLVQAYAAEGRCTGAARFTHVVDNAVVLDKVQESIDDNGIIRCHGADIEFYVQSAVESAQLLLLSGLNPTSRLRMVAIRSLGDPIRLLPMMLGKIKADARHGHPTIYLSGYDRGYEKGNPPGLYDPLVAADLSPLINAIEAQGARAYDDVEDVDQFNLSLPTDGVEAVVDELEDACRVDEPVEIAAALAHAVKVEAQAMFELCPEPLFRRLNKMAVQGGVALPTTRVPA